ncbi:MAG TPA: hypothetical protein DGT23_35240 [Micromonosporaceae bacterium]|nr:hypothetical protein [Micromonosporaceae bacterium]
MLTTDSAEAAFIAADIAVAFAATFRMCGDAVSLFFRKSKRSAVSEIGPPHFLDRWDSISSRRCCIAAHALRNVRTVSRSNSHGRMCRFAAMSSS